MVESHEYTEPGAGHLHRNATGAPAPSRFTPALLLLANLIPLVGVLLWRWEVGLILLLYWAENLIVGVFNLLRILSYGQPRALFLAAFFTLHYGGFCAAHGALLMSLFDYPPGPAGSGSELLEGLPVLGLLAPAIDTVLTTAPPLWLWGFAALAGSHAASFFFNFLLRNERAATSPARLMTTPYQRILILHVVLVAGGVAVAALGAPLVLLVLLVALKIGIDLRAHLRERRRQPPPQAV